MKIVVVDDEMYALQSFLSEIIDVDVDCKFFKDDEKAILDYVSKNEVAAVFCDVGMPNINGVALAEKLIAQQPDVAIVFVTGMSLTMSDLSESVRANTLGFLYKPYNADKLTEFVNVIRKRTPILSVKMFDVFDCFVDGKLVMFSSAKSKELLALLVAYNGNSLTMTDAIDHLWPNSTVEKAKVLYRNAVFRLRRALADAGVNCVSFGRALLTLDKTRVQCDYWDYLQLGGDAYRGEFCKNYDWSIEYLPNLDKIANLTKKSS
ncbi:MAG: response regulator [Clostridiales bacterium]|nr:response regulator [Clostridiales bacterium]